MARGRRRGLRKDDRRRKQQREQRPNDMSHAYKTHGRWRRLSTPRSMIVRIHFSSPPSGPNRALLLQYAAVARREQPFERSPGTGHALERVAGAWRSLERLFSPSNRGVLE